MNPELRQAVIDKMFKESEPVEETKESPPSASIEGDPPKDGAPRSKYDLGGALKEVLGTKTEQSSRPKATDKEREACGQRMDKKLLLEMMGNFRR